MVYYIYEHHMLVKGKTTIGFGVMSAEVIEKNVDWLATKTISSYEILSEIQDKLFMSNITWKLIWVGGRQGANMLVEEIPLEEQVKTEMDNL